MFAEAAVNSRIDRILERASKKLEEGRARATLESEQQGFQRILNDMRGTRPLPADQDFWWRKTHNLLRDKWEEQNPRPDTEKNLGCTR